MEDLTQVNKAKPEDEKEEVPVGEHDDATQVSQPNSSRAFLFTHS